MHYHNNMITYTATDAYVLEECARRCPQVVQQIRDEVEQQLRITNAVRGWGDDSLGCVWVGEVVNEESTSNGENKGEDNPRNFPT